MSLFIVGGLSINTSMKKLTTSDIHEWLVTDGRGYELLSEYVRAIEPVKLRCPCGNTWSMSMNSVKKGQGCPICSRSRTKEALSHTKENIVEWLKVNKPTIQLVGDYKNSHTKTTFGCQCGNEWDATPSSVKFRSGCPKCSREAFGKKRRCSAEDIRQWLVDDGRGIKLLTEYVNDISMSTFKCPNPDHSPWTTTMNSVKRGSGCPSCAQHGFNVKKPAWRYILFFENAARPFIKVGITNDLKRRLSNHRKNGEFTLVWSHLDDVGLTSLDWENSIKRSFGGSFVSRNECPDGFTETYHPQLCETILRHNL